MPTNNETKAAIRAIPDMIGDISEGEWRVTVTLESMKSAYPEKGAKWWADRRESLAHYTNDAEDAVSTAASMSKSWAQEKATMANNNTPPERERVYDFDNTQQDGFQTMFARLRAQGFQPETDSGARDGKQMTGITLAPEQAAELRKLQYTEPRTWGNHPAVMAQMAENRKEIEVSTVRRKVRLDALTPDQREFIEVLHYQSKDRLQVDAALDLNDKLHELSAQHQRLAQINVNESGLTPKQELARQQVEREIVSLFEEVPGGIGAAFSKDPRGTTVGVIFESGASNSMNGTYKVPLNPARVAELQHEDFSDFELAEAGPSGYVVLSIDKTGNAAFADMGRNEEIARIVRQAADKIEGMRIEADLAFPLSDVNGNSVGKAAVLSKAPAEAIPEGGLRLAIELGNDAFVIDPGQEVSRILREAAGQIRDGATDFQMHDLNGQNVGRYEFVPVASLEKDGRIDMDAALRSGNVYLADDGHSGIADGEYRYVVCAEGFEPGYHQGEGDAWLVNAKGELASGYEEPQTVKENGFRELNKGEQTALREVVDGRVSFEDFEKTFDDADLEP